MLWLMLCSLSILLFQIHWCPWRGLLSCQRSYFQFCCFRFIDLSMFMPVDVAAKDFQFCCFRFVKGIAAAFQRGVTKAFQFCCFRFTQQSQHSKSLRERLSILLFQIQAMRKRPFVARVKDNGLSILLFQIQIDENTDGIDECLVILSILLFQIQSQLQLHKRRFNS